MGLIDEIFHYVIQLYREEKKSSIFTEIDTMLDGLFGHETYQAFLKLFVSEFPPNAVYTKTLTPEQYLSQSTNGIQNRENVLEELLLYWLENQNPALKPFKELFESPDLTSNPHFEFALHTIRQVFAEELKFGPENQSLVDMLLSPSIAVPNDLSGQLEYIREKWSSLLGSFLYRLLIGLDVLKEENKLGFGGPGPVEVPVYRKGNVFGTEEAEMFSADRDWMPRLVLIAKNAYVWLDQLSKKYQRSITRLDQIPEEELKTLAERGFTGLWLIGLWERSRASAKIKQLLGNPDAIASAYSLHSYDIAADLGGEAGLPGAARPGLEFGYSPGKRHGSQPHGYRFRVGASQPRTVCLSGSKPIPQLFVPGTDLSSDPNVVIQIEDHYYDRSDAAVVFRRIEKRNGETKYIYHGNDGTSMPWNDTAQLNYLDPQVRETVIQTILDVARKFPIIRFDAAMTLAKKHYQRLWFPQPGTGGDIPSRAEHSLTQEQFDQAMPVEFWREVVDRVAKEAPDTLLLAEAFWMMEGYFVRTLGMHRVYNSAFMNMLRNEDNAHYRQLLKNTLEFEPEILKRYVNFMNNPDERTAVDQFGKGDKYFGICALMSTLPGLPMFGHGQVEGFSEKYGMEFRRAYIDEQPDPELVNRHNQQIAPLLHRRELFAGVENFWLFDFYLSNGSVNENVYAYTNSFMAGKTLVVYNNAYPQTEGWIKNSVAQLVRQDNQKRMQQTQIADQLTNPTSSNDYLIFRDQISGLQYLRPCSQIRQDGLHFRLNGYESHVFIDFKQVSVDAWHSYDRLYKMLGENGVPDIDSALGTMLIQPILNAAMELLSPSHLQDLMNVPVEDLTVDPVLPVATPGLINALLQSISRTTGIETDLEHHNQKIQSSLRAALKMRSLDKWLAQSGLSTSKQVAEQLARSLNDSPIKLASFLIFSMLHGLGFLKDPSHFEEISAVWFDEWQLNRVAKDTLKRMGSDSAQAEQCVDAIRMMITEQRWYSQCKKLDFSTVLRNWMTKPEIQRFLKVNRFEGQVWFNADAYTDFEELLTLLPVFEVTHAKSHRPQRCSRDNFGQP